jgi:hypothetical protein
MGRVTMETPLRAALIRAHARWARVAEFPPAVEWVPLAGTVGTNDSQLKQRLEATVPTVPTVPTETEGGATAAPPMTADEEERAAILEFDGGLDRPTAERLAQACDADWSGS